MLCDSIRQELVLFGTAVLQGVFLCLVYDVLRSWRNVAPSGKKMSGITDFVYWISCGCYLFYTVLRSGQGGIRGYQFLGIFLGLCLWKRIFSSPFVRICGYFLSYPVFFVNFLRKRLFFFLKRCRILECQIFKRREKGKSSV